MTAAHYKGGHHPGNGLGLHYTALPPIVASCPYSDQLLATRKFWSPGANRPSQVRAHRFKTTLAHSDGVAFAALAVREGVSRSYFTRVVRLSYLAPDITQAILDGRQPRDLTTEKLLAASRLPLAWRDQRAALGFA